MCALEAYCSQAVHAEAAALKEGTVCAVQKTGSGGEWARILREGQTQVGCRDDHPPAQVSLIVSPIACHSASAAACLSLVGPSCRQWRCSALEWAAVCVPAPRAQPGASSGRQLLSVW